MVPRKIQSQEDLYLNKRLQIRLQQMVSSPLTVVTAPVGSGKTAAVLTGLRQNKIPFCLLNPLEGRTGNLRRLTEFCPGALSVLGDLSGDPLELALAFRQAVGERRRFLVVDHYQLVSRQEDRFFQALAAQAVRQAKGFGLILIGRERIPWSAEWLLSGQGTAITLRELSLELEEIPAFLQCMGLSFEEKQMKSLYQLTSGWIPALQSCIRQYELDGDLRLPPDFDLWMRHAALDGLGDEQLWTLLTLSPFEQFTFEQAEFLSRLDLFEERGPAPWEEVFQVCPFLSVNGETIQPHPVFWHCIRQLFSALPFRQQQRIYRRAGEWCLGRQDDAGAVSFFSRAGAVQPLLQMLVENRLVKLPYNLCRQALDCLKKASAVLENGPHQWRLALLESGLEEDFRERPAALAPDTGWTDWICALAQEEAGSLGDAVEMLQLLTAPWPLIHFCRGGLQASEVLAKLHKAAQLPGAKEPLNGLLTIIEGDLALLQGDLGRADSLARRGCMEAAHRQLWGLFLGGKVLLACVASLRFRYLEAQQELLQARERLESQRIFSLLPVADCCISLCSGRSRENSEAVCTLGESVIDQQTLFPAQRIFYALCRMEEFSVQRDFVQLAAASEYMAHLLDSPPLQVTLMCCQAAAFFQLDRRAGGEEILKEAFFMAQKDRLWLPFAFGELAVHLQELVDDEAFSAIGQLVKQLEPGIRRRVSCLTDRERRLAQLAARGFSNREIGERLFLSENTVKSCMKVIFNKLDIRSRRELRALFDME